MNPERLLIDRIVDTICSPFQGPHTDDAVQLQIIKVNLKLKLRKKLFDYVLGNISVSFEQHV